MVDWYEDDEMMRQWEEVSKEEGMRLQRKTEGNALHIEGLQTVPQLVVSQVLPAEKEKTTKERKGKVAGWSTEKMEEKASSQLEKDTEDMVSWRSLNQPEINEPRKKCWKHTTWRTAKEEPTEEEVSLRNGDNPEGQNISAWKME